MGHCTTVLAHLNKAIEPKSSELTLSEQRQLTLQLAALLHDADDRKYFKESNNADYIIAQSLKECDSDSSLRHDEIKDDALRFIDYVSTSKNGNSVP